MLGLKILLMSAVISIAYVVYGYSIVVGWGPRSGSYDQHIKAILLMPLVRLVSRITGR